MFKKIDTEKIRKDAYEAGFKFGIEAGKEFNKGLISKQALDLFCQQNWLVNPNHVFQLTKTGIPYLNQEPIKKDKVRELKAQAEIIQNTELWSIFQNTIKQQAIDLGLKTSKNYDEVLPAKMMLHNLGILQKIIDSLLTVKLEEIPNTSGGISKDIH